MYVTRLALDGFRSYPSLEIEFPAGPQVIVGPNAAGKTNLLEAIAVLGLGQSHRTSTDTEMVGWGRPFARIEGDVTGDSLGSGPGRDRLEVVLRAAGASGARKRVKVNGVPRRAGSLAEALPVVVFAPEDMLLVSGSPSLRRSALDTLLVQRTGGAAAVLSTYTRALQQRNNLLRSVREGTAAPDELSYWTQLIWSEGGRIIAWRLETLEALAQPVAEAHAEIAPGEGRLSLRYVTNAPLAPGEEPAEALRRRLAETAEKELWNGSTLVGPHRDDLAFQLGERELAGFASRGQQRTAILAFKLAQLELLASMRGTPPLLMLDDVFSELDPDRRSHLVRRIGELPQAFVTTTTLADLDARLAAASTAWRAVGGRLERVRP